MTIDWQRELQERHPRLFRDPEPPHHIVGSIETAEGWRDVVERACGRIEAALDPDDRVTVSQVKSKFGTLRIYWEGMVENPVTGHAIEDAIALAEARSACTCETCGEEGRLHYWNGWYRTSCREHAQGGPVARRPGWEGIHIVRGYSEGRVTITFCRRYHRESDTFSEVDPASLGIDQ